MRLTAVLPLTALAAMAGCAGSRWARQDPTYARKYRQHTDEPLKVAKQAIDARQVAGRGGFYTTVAAASGPEAVDASVGRFVYLPNLGGAVETRVGLRGSAVDSGGLAAGVEFGGRVQTPTRLAPFVGVGGFAGMAPWDYLDNSEPFGEDDETGAVSIAPEVGVHYWLTPRWRLTASASQNYSCFFDSNETRSGEFTSVGLTLAWLDNSGYRSKRRTPPPPAVESCSTEIASAEASEQLQRPPSVDRDAETNPYAALLEAPPANP